MPYQNKKKITAAVYMITYNHEDYIEQAIKSIITQKTNFYFKLFIGEDYSSDKTREICIRFKKKYPELIDLTLNKKNKGVFKNANNIFRKCFQSKADYIAICEGDDYWTDPNKLQKQVDFLENNLSYTLHCHNYIKVNEAGDMIKDDKNEKINCQEITINNFLKNYIIITNSVVFRNVLSSKEITRKGFKDIFLFALLLDKGLGWYDSKKMSAYRVHDGGIWSKQNEFTNHLNNTLTSLALHKYFKRKYEHIDNFNLNNLKYLIRLFQNVKNKREIRKWSYYLLKYHYTDLSKNEKKTLIKNILHV